MIPGSKHADKVRENVRLVAAEIPAALWHDLRREGLIPADAPTPTS